MSAITFGAWPAGSSFRMLDPSAHTPAIMYAPTGRSFAIVQRPVGQYFAPEPVPVSVSQSVHQSHPTTSSVPPSQQSAGSTFQGLPPRRKRASRPKVRTGCTTCKIRRIKCDETKPSCLRCTSTGRRCDGYAFPKPPTSDTPPSALLPPAKKPAVTFTGLILPSSMSTPFQGTIHEKRIFHRFQVRTVPAFSGGSETSFWHSLVLKVGQDEPVVRNAIIALGSLHEDYQIRGGKYDLQLHEDKSYRDITLLYGKALRQLNEQLNKPTKANAKLAIICSILFACFEVLRRNNMAAVVHYQQGMRQLIRQMNLPEGDEASIAKYSQDLPYEAKFREIPQSELDDMMRVFARYDIQACTFSKDRAETLATTVPTVLPTNFTLQQVRLHLDNLLICVYQLVKSDLSMYRYFNLEDVPTQWQTRRQEAVETFEGWLSALEGFFQTAEVTLSPFDAKSLLGLRLQIKVAIIMLRVSIDSKPEMTFDKFLSDFEDIVSRVERLTESLALIDGKPLEVEQTDFSMELGIIHPLFFVATKCRNWNLRRRAIAQLKKGGKEGVWEGPIMAVLAQRLMRIEEQGIARGTTVPERNRFHEIKKNVDYDGRNILVEATRAVDDTYKNWHTHREAVAF